MSFHLWLEHEAFNYHDGLVGGAGSKVINVLCREEVNRKHAQNIKIISKFLIFRN